jgi:hypothetical protein
VEARGLFEESGLEPTATKVARKPISTSTDWEELVLEVVAWDWPLSGMIRTKEQADVRTAR